MIEYDRLELTIDVERPNAELLDAMQWMYDAIEAVRQALKKQHEGESYVQ